MGGVMPDTQDERTDRMIRDAFVATARPSPSLYFNSRLRVALAEEKRRKRAAKTRMRIMQAYWILSGLAAVFIMSMLPWSESTDGAWLPLLVVTAVVALPMLLVRVDLIDLILGSVEKCGIIPDRRSGVSPAGYPTTSLTSGRLDP